MAKRMRCPSCGDVVQVYKEGAAKGRVRPHGPNSEPCPGGIGEPLIGPPHYGYKPAGRK